ncbi:unnamed protein product [Rhizopus stolonifer]
MRSNETREASPSYWLPKDENEQQRLTVQHLALKELYDGNVLSSIRNSLDFEKGISILDVGCGSGIWIMDMITEYPHCTYQGCDIVDTTNKVLKISQFTFNYGNVFKGLPYADNTFDYVNMRLLIFALRKKEWPQAIKELVRVTKPKGMIQLTETILTLIDGEPQIHHAVKAALIAVCKSREQNPKIAKDLESILEKNEKVKIIQLDARTCNMNSNTNTARKFVWDCIEGLRGVWDTVGPILGKTGERGLEEVTVELEACLTTEDSYFSVNSIAVQKL